MVSKNHLIGEGERKKVCAKVPSEVKDRLEEEVDNMAGSYSQGVVLTQALREYLEISELADEVDMLREIADSLGTSSNPSPPPQGTWRYEEWSELNKNSVNTRIPKSVYDVVREQDDTTGLVVTNTLEYYLGSKNEVEQVRELIREIHSEFDTESSEDEIKLQNLKSRDDANKRRVVINYLESSPLNRVTADDVEEILIKEASYAPSTAENKAETVVSQLTPLPTARVDWEDCRDEDIEKNRINKPEDDIKHSYNNQYNYLDKKLNKGYCVGNTFDSVIEDIEYVFDWEFKNVRRETFARHCLVEATEFEGVDAEDVEEVVPRQHHDLLDSSASSAESRFSRDDYELYAEERDAWIGVFDDELDDDDIELVDGFDVVTKNKRSWFEQFDDSDVKLAKVLAMQRVTGREVVINETFDELLESATKLELDFE